MANTVVYEHLDNLVSLEDTSSHVLVPQYACLLRATLTQATLRRCFSAFVPMVPPEAFQQADAATVALASRSIPVRSLTSSLAAMARCMRLMQALHKTVLGASQQAERSADAYEQSAPPPPSHPSALRCVSLHWRQ